MKESKKQLLSVIVIFALLLLVVAFFATAIDGISGMIDDTTKPKPAETTTKLDCEHEETILGENGNAYCKDCNKLTALKAPVIAVSENTVTWARNIEAEKYSVYINGNKVKTVTTTSYEFIASGGGDYVVTVKAEKGTMISEVSNSHTFKVLASPTISLNGDIVTWSAVANADAYVLYFDYEGLGWRVLDMLRNADELSASDLKFDLRPLLKDILVENQSVKVAVVAEDAGDSVYTQSSLSNQLTWTYIPETYSVTKNVTNGTLSGAETVKENSIYTATLKASDYYFINQASLAVTMDGETLTVGTDYTVTYADIYTATIKIPGVSGDLSITASCTADTLPAPASISVSGSKVTWTAVSGASSYFIRVQLDGASREFNVTTTSFDILNNGYGDSGGYEVSVWARSPIGALSNAKTISFTYLEKPIIIDAGATAQYAVNIKLPKNSVATSYTVYLNGLNCQSSVDATNSDYYIISIPNNELDIGINDVYIILHADGVSATSNTLTFTYSGASSETPETGGEATGPFTVNISTMDSYACDTTDYSRVSSFTVNKGQTCSFYLLSNAGFDIGSITVKANGITSLVQGSDYTVTMNPEGAPSAGAGQEVALVTIHNVTSNIQVDVTCTSV